MVLSRRGASHLPVADPKFLGAKAEHDPDVAVLTAVGRRPGSTTARNRHRFSTTPSPRHDDPLSS